MLNNDKKKVGNINTHILDLAVIINTFHVSNLRRDFNEHSK